MCIIFKFLFSITCIVFMTMQAKSQVIQLISSGTKSSFRGLSVVDDRVIWVSGSSGMIGRSVDSGKTFRWAAVAGFEKTDFRDVEGFSDMEAVIMGIAEPAHILRTNNGGQSWTIVYENKSKGMFLDAMDFFDEKNGMVIGDPVDGNIFMARTTDGGNSWTGLALNELPVADSGEACFASSGTNISMLSADRPVFITGGKASNLYIGTKKISPLNLVEENKTTTGANSIGVKNKKTFIVVGGDFTEKNAAVKNCLITNDGGRSWSTPAIPPNGYRSCVMHLHKKRWISCGLNGVDLSYDDGKNWKWISRQSFHVCSKAKKGSAVYFAGSNGQIGKLVTH